MPVLWVVRNEIVPTERYGRFWAIWAHDTTYCSTAVRRDVPAQNTMCSSFWMPCPCLLFLNFHCWSQLIYPLWWLPLILILYQGTVTYLAELSASHTKMGLDSRIGVESKYSRTDSTQDIYFIFFFKGNAWLMSISYMIMSFLPTQVGLFEKRERERGGIFFL